MSFVDLIFSWLNFGVLLALLGYVFYSQFLPKFIRDIRDRRAQRLAAEKLREEFFEKLAHIQEERERREQTYQEVLGKVVQWKQAEIERQEALKLESARVLVLAEERFKKGRERAAMQRIRARVVPQALAQARLELYDFFQKDRAGDAYIEGVIKVVEQRTKESYGRGA
ncbi:TPA: hypothetical protein DDZ86_01665 [Candidatus Dependentiae bacterium]|nr:MAG: hypothetical protein UW09_C0001G0303 [candidate division TM6 bacterium GW2011_GWF2_43_87]HBL98332.1 hypothetical protein [Candidatus Dependentiae bacterium]